MEALEFVKLIIEIIATGSTACVVICHFFEKKPVKKFFSKTLPLFFFGIVTEDGKKLKGFKAIKENKIRLERTQNIIKTIAPDYTFNELYAINEEELLKFIHESNFFTKIQLRQ